MSIRTPLAKVKHLGSAKLGSQHYVHQRVSALLMIPLLFWFIYSVLRFFFMPDSLLDFYTSPLQMTMLVLFLGTFLYHGTLGMRAVIEDYIHCKFLLNLSLITLNLVSIISFVAGVVVFFSVYNIHIIARTLQ
jgi:succinate dehydrogenase / fumarate reductase membrane anchor subunit